MCVHNTMRLLNLSKSSQHFKCFNNHNDPLNVSRQRFIVLYGTIYRYASFNARFLSKRLCKRSFKIYSINGAASPTISRSHRRRVEEQKTRGSLACHPCRTETSLPSDFPHHVTYQNVLNGVMWKTERTRERPRRPRAGSCPERRRPRTILLNVTLSRPWIFLLDVERVPGRVLVQIPRSLHRERNAEEPTKI